MYNNEKRREKLCQINHIFINTLNIWKSDDKIIKLYEEGYSPLQVTKLWLNNTHSEIKKVKLDFNSKTFIPFETLSDVTLSAKLKKHLPYSKKNHELHLSKPQFWKVRCNHLDKTDAEVQVIVENQLKSWAGTTQEKRRKGSIYSKDNTAEYWMEKCCLSYEDALEKARQHKREKSPFSVVHWIKKGLSEEAAREQAKKCHRAGGVAATKKCGLICTSNLERQIYACLVADFPLLESQYVINDIFVYDICLPDSKKIIEVNGTYWHADPRVYSENSLVRDVLVKKIWNRDKSKCSYAKHRGYDVLVVWELDFCKSKENTLKLIKEFLQQD